MLCAVDTLIQVVAEIGDKSKSLTNTTLDQIVFIALGGFWGFFCDGAGLWG